MIKVILFAVVTLFMVGCGDDAPKSANSETQTKQEVKEEVKAVVAEVKEEAKAAVTQTKEEVTSVVVEETKAIVEDVKAAAAAEALVVVETPAVTVDVVSIYKVCAGCHGVDASKSALNKSQIIKGWNAKKIADALHGYKTGTYGGAMKGLMGAQVSKLGDAEIEALSIHISKF